MAASTDATAVMPPALFGSKWFEKLEGLSGDVGARSLLRHAKTVRASPDELLDIDHPEIWSVRMLTALDLIAVGSRHDPPLWRAAC